MSSAMVTATALVLAGGDSVRFGGDKLGADLDGRPVLDHLLASLPTSWPVVVIGAPRPVCRAVTWAREEPAGGGPLAAIAAGVVCATTDLVVVVGGDMPFAGSTAARLVEQLVARRAVSDVGAVTARLSDGRAQPLLTAYVTQAMRDALPATVDGGRARLLLDRIGHDVVDVEPEALLDVDTPDALERARAHLRTRGRGC